MVERQEALQQLERAAIFFAAPAPISMKVGIVAGKLRGTGTVASEVEEIVVRLDLFVTKRSENSAQDGAVLEIRRAQRLKSTFRQL